MGELDGIQFVSTFCLLLLKKQYLYLFYTSSVYDKNTIFGVQKDGEKVYFKNTYSEVAVSGSSQKFRNPPSFINLNHLGNHLGAQYETDAVLDHYFRHPNTAPFLATMMIKRFGISSPSPTYISNVATAFKEGTYVSNGM